MFDFWSVLSTEIVFFHQALLKDNNADTQIVRGSSFPKSDTHFSEKDRREYKYIV